MAKIYKIKIEKIKIFNLRYPVIEYKDDILKIIDLAY